MKRYYKRIIAVILSFMVMIGVLPGIDVLAAKGDLGEGYNIDNLDFTFSSVDGDDIPSASNEKVKVILFARTNGNCYNSAEAMSSLSKADWTASDDVEVLVVDIDFYDAESVKSFSDTYGSSNLIFCYDETSNSNNLMWDYLWEVGNTSYSVTLPVTVIIDKNNKVQYCNTGYTNADEIYDYVDYILNGKIDDDVIDDKKQIKVYTDGFYDYDSAEEVVNYTNEFRSDVGRSKLVMDEKLTELAMQRAAECALYYSHTRPDGNDCFTIFPNEYLVAAGENIAFGYVNASEVSNGWYNSEGHYANMINENFTSIGVGSFKHNGVMFWVQLFSGYTGETYADKESTFGSAEIDAIVSNVGDFSLDIDNSTLKVGDTVNGRLYISNIAGGGYLSLIAKSNNVIFKSSDTDIATVDASGTVKACSPGNVTITATLDETLVAEFDISVYGTSIENPKLMGDVDSNRVVDAADALEVLKYAARLRDFSEDEWSLAEVTKDSIVDASDALMILKYAAKIIDSLE